MNKKIINYIVAFSIVFGGISSKACAGFIAIQQAQELAQKMLRGPWLTNALLTIRNSADEYGCVDEDLAWTIVQSAKEASIESIKRLYEAQAKEKKSLIQSWRERLASNKKALSTPSCRYMIPSEKCDHPLLCLLSLRQPNGWLCGIFCCFNMAMINHMINNKSTFDFNRLEGLCDRLINYEVYTFEKFKGFYQVHVIEGKLWSETYQLKPDELSGLHCRQPDPLQDQRVNYLGTDQLWWLVENLGFQDCCFILTIPDKGLPIGVENPDLQIQMFNPGLAYDEVTYNTLKEKRVTFLANKALQALYFICQTEGTIEGGGHWIFITIFKDKEGSQKLAMILMDPSKDYLQEVELNKDSRHYIEYLGKIFFPHVYFG